MPPNIKGALARAPAKAVNLEGDLRSSTAKPLLSSGWQDRQPHWVHCLLQLIQSHSTMKKRGRPERANDQRRLLCFLFLTIQQRDTVWAIFPLHRRNAWKSGGASARARIKEILQNRGGAINWDEHSYSDYSDAEEPTFLPNEEEEEEQEEEQQQQEEEGTGEEQEQQPQNKSQFESDEEPFDAGESDSDLRVAPFLESFQREIHSIVHDYRQEVSDTFQHLKDDILNSQERYSRTSRPTPPEKYIDEYGSEDDEDVDVQKTTQKRRGKPVIEEESDDDFIVGDTDEDEDNVMFRLKEERDDDSEDAWDNLTWDEEEKIEASTGNFRADVEGPLKEKAKKKRRRRSGKKKDKAPASQRTHVNNDDSEVVGEHPSVAEESAPRESGQGFLDRGASPDASLMAAGSRSLSNSEMWKSASVAISVLAMAILLNIAFQILSKMLWK